VKRRKDKEAKEWGRGKLIKSEKKEKKRGQKKKKNRLQRENLKQD